MFLSETINSNTISIFATTTTFILAINKCGDLTIDNSNIIVKKPNTNNNKKKKKKKNPTSYQLLALHAVNLHVLLVIIDPVHTTAQELAVVLQRIIKIDYNIYRLIILIFQAILSVQFCK